MVGSVRHGEYHLLIVDASVTDEGSYQCHLAATDDEKMHHSSEIAHLTVSGMLSQYYSQQESIVHL